MGIANCVVSIETSTLLLPKLIDEQQNTSQFLAYKVTAECICTFRVRSDVGLFDLCITVRLNAGDLLTYNAHLRHINVEQGSSWQVQCNKIDYSIKNFSLSNFLSTDDLIGRLHYLLSGE